MKNENRNEEAVSPVIATILMVAITVVLAGVLYVWASSLAEGNTGSGLVLRNFSAEDAAGSPGAGTEDALVYVSMSQADDGINWAYVKLSISVDGGADKVCANPGADASSSDCAVDGDSDSTWNIGDQVTVSESGQNLCNADCSVTITLYDTDAGKEMQTIKDVSVN